MILINLLPHRDAARKRRTELFQVTLVASVLFGVMVAVLVYVWYDAQIAHQRSANQMLENEIKRLESQIKDVADLQAEITALKARQQAVEDLQADRNMPVHMLNEIVRLLPNGVYITALRQDNLVVTLQGMAQSNERVSELLRNLANNSPWLERPDLVEIVAASVTLGPKDQRRVASFVVKVRLRRAAEAASVASAIAAVNSASTVKH